MHEDALIGIRNIVGLDIGDGESCLTWTTTETGTSVQEYLRAGATRPSILTALARCRGADGYSYLIGDEALRDREAMQFHINFKHEPGPGRRIQDAVAFGHTLLDEFFDQNEHIRQGCAIVIGHPASWSREAVDRYRRQMQYDELSTLVLTESQSALVHVRERQASHENLLDNVLVVDVGSSTTDVTVVRDLVPDNLPIGGGFGCREIDNKLAERVRQELDDDESFHEALERAGGQELLHLLCRVAKEAQFRREKQRLPQIDWVHRANLAAIRDLGFGLLRQLSIPELVTGEFGWAEGFRGVMHEAQMEEPAPSLVILTGGGSRMPFLVDICREVFPDIDVERDEEKPSESVARGLALAGRHRVRVAEFRKEIGALATSPKTVAKIEDEARAAILSANASLVSELQAAKPYSWTQVLDAPKGRNEALQRFRGAIEGYLVPIALQLCERYQIDQSRFGFTIDLPPGFGHEIVGGTFGGSSSPLSPADGRIIGQAVSDVANGFVVHRGLQHPVMVAFATARLATVAAMQGIAWNERRKLLTRIAAAEPSREVLQELKRNATSQLLEVMEQRAYMLERWVK